MSIFQGSVAGYSPSVDPLDEQEYCYDIGKLLDSDQLLTTQYHSLTEQARQPTISMISPSLSLTNTSNRGATGLQATSLFHFVMPPYGEIDDNYPLFNNFSASSMQQHERGMVYSQQSHHSQQQMPLTVEQISNHTVEDYSSSTLVKSEPWFGFESLYI